MNTYKGKISWDEYKEIRAVHGFTQNEFCLVLSFLDDEALVQQMRNTASHCMAASIPGAITYEQILTNVLVPLITNRLVTTSREGEDLRAKIVYMKRAAKAKEIIMDRWAASARFVKGLFSGETTNN